AGVTGLTTDGISAADARNGNPERDGYDNVTVSLAGEKVLDQNLTAFGSLLLINSHTEFDDGFSNPPTDEANIGDRRQFAGRGGVTHQTNDGRTRNTVSVQINDIDRTLLFASSFGDYVADYTSNRMRMDWLGEHDLTDQLTIQAGADYERTQFTFSDNFGGAESGGPWIAGGWVQAIWSPVDGLTLTGAARRDEHSNFGGFTTWRTTAAYLFAESGTKLRGSVATGFRAPSPYELFADPDGIFGTAVANPNLRPEESFSWDVGVDQTLLDGALTVSATYFELDTDNLIDYVNDVGYVQAPGTAERNGVEASLRWAVTDWADVTAAYTYTRSIEADGDRRARVPAHDLVVGLFTRPAERWNTATTVRFVSDTVDIDSDTRALLPLDDYVLVNAKVGYEPIDGLEIYVRGENLLDEKYQVVRGYGTPGASVYGGFTMQW
ncbi:MAG: TonB-dependent receptor, partial [Anderseniella sp.]|nr:TonB-dependent receptor [Anderseniella sp.]